VQQIVGRFYPPSQQDGGWSSPYGYWRIKDFLRATGIEDDTFEDMQASMKEMLGAGYNDNG
jgi:hypothetical protein